MRKTFNILKMLLMLAVFAGGAAQMQGQTTLFSYDFANWTGPATIDSETEVLYDGMYFKTKSNRPFNFANGVMTWPGNNLDNNNYYIRIPLTGINGSLTIKVWNGNANTRVYYYLTSGNSQDDRTATSAGNPVEITFITDVTAGNLFIGRYSSAYTTATKIEIQTPTPPPPPVPTWIGNSYVHINNLNQYYNCSQNNSSNDDFSTDPSSPYPLGFIDSPLVFWGGADVDKRALDNVYMFYRIDNGEEFSVVLPYGGAVDNSNNFWYRNDANPVSIDANSGNHKLEVWFRAGEDDEDNDYIWDSNNLANYTASFNVPYPDAYQLAYGNSSDPWTFVNFTQVNATTWEITDFEIPENFETMNVYVGYNEGLEFAQWVDGKSANKATSVYTEATSGTIGKWTITVPYNGTNWELTFTPTISYYFPERGKWHLVSAPLATVDLSNFTFNKQPGVAIRKLNSTATQGTWESFTQDEFEAPLAAGSAFAYWINPTENAGVYEDIIIAGGKITFDYDIALDNVGKTIEAGKLFTLVGNPFDSEFEFSALAAANSGVIKNTGYYDDGDYDGKNYTLLSGDVIPIKPWQGFIVEAADGLPGGTLTFTKSGLNISSAPALVAQNPSLLTVTTTNDAGSLWTYIRQNSEGSDVFGNADGSFMESPANEFVQIYSLKADANGNTRKAAMSTFSAAEALIPLGVSTTHNGNLTLNFAGMDSYACNVTLIDNQTERPVDLTGLASYDYQTSINGSADTRFALQFGQPVPTGTQANEYANVQAFVSGGQINVRANAGNDIQNVKVFSVSGTLAANETAVNSTHFVLKQQLPAGIYLVKIQTAKEIRTQKVVLK
ncbi:MAG: T9SS type A sorting domain-containing protein [Prevotellaceae bacterium]|jgi:hypothetical protein|nr:T9SS type A sorting domain-containing protein [Prevotellaceae bacterium]